MFLTLMKCQKITPLVTLQHAMRSKSIILNKKFEGFPSEDNFKVIEEDLAPIKNGEFLVEAEYLSVDPYMRTFSTSADVGKPMMGEQVAKIVESKNAKYPVGQYVIGEFGWRTRTIANETPGRNFKFPPRLLRDYDNIPKSLALGVLGMPGNAAYFGFLNICQPVEGNTVVISGASGAVGSHVGQIAKIKGCHVVGITGSDEKGKRLVDELQFDAYVNYKSDDFTKQLAEATPNRIDCYFDNVGGEISSVVLNRMNKFGRVAICGSISTYNATNTQKASEVQTPVKVNHLKMEGFSVNRWHQKWDEGIQQNLRWLLEGKLKYSETVTYGFENTAKAFIGMLKGANFGKAIVKAS